MTITFHPDGRVEGSGAANFGSSGNIIQTVIGTNGESSSSDVNLVSADINNPTFLDSNCKITITPKRSNSKICLIWSAQIRMNPSSSGYVGMYYSSNSNMSSPTLVEKARGASIQESYRNLDDNHQFYSWSRMCWDETISNTNTRYYNVAGMNIAGNLYYGDQGVALQIMAQEIAA